MRKHISRFLLNLTRHSRMRKFRELEKNAFLPPETLRARQQKALARMIEHARTNVPYYRNILAGREIRSLEDLASLPFLTKKAIRDNLEGLKAVNCPPSRFIQNSTGGSTGEKLEFFSDTDQILAALLLRSNTWAGWNVGEKQAQLWGAHYDVSRARGFVNGLKCSLIQRNMLLSSYRMSEQDMLEYQKRLNRYKPSLITGYPSALALFSEFLRANDLKIHSPKGIVTSAETLYPHQREMIESVFGCGVFNRYGCREAGNIAQECEEHNGLHIFSEHVIVEVVDERGDPAPPGRRGEIVVTKLDNFVFPFIRYRIGDLGALSERSCPCGRNLPMLESVEGRVFDIIVGTNGNHLSGTFWTILLREYVSGISRFQVIQEEFGKILLRLEVENDFSEKEREKLISKIRERCGEDMIVEIEAVDEIEQTESGKHRFVISKVSPYLQGRSKERE